MKNKKKVSSMNGAAVAAVILALLIVVIMGVLFINPWKKPITDFEQCKAVGGAILESYPEQCLYDGSTYINESQQVGTGSEYIGLSEGSALDKAKQSNIAARVVEREGEGLSVTMDFVFGRHNFYIKDNAVYKVEVEGQASDTN